MNALSDDGHANEARAAFASRSKAHLAMILGVLVLSLASATIFAPAASAAPGEQCWTRTYNGKVTVEKNWKRDGKLAYSATWTWCGKNDKVTKFIVKSTRPAPGTTGAYVDIRPFNPGAFGGPVYDIFINTTLGKKSDYRVFHLSGWGTILQS